MWDDRTDAILDGDLTAALAYVTPAGGAVVTPVAPIGLRDRQANVVTFTTSLGFGRKLDRIRNDPSVALAYHAREHGFADGDDYVLVQGRATVDERADGDRLDAEVRPAAARFMGPPKTGVFWDRWLQAYYQDRVPVDVAVERVVRWPDLRCAGEPSVVGEAPAESPAPQSPPKNGTGPRVDVDRAAERLRALPHVLLGFRGGDGLPVVVPVEVGDAGADGIELRATPGLLPAGGRRAGVLAHSYRAKLIGLATRQHTGWLEVDGGRAIYAPHTEQGFKAPANKTVLLLANGFMARRGLKKAQRQKAA